jgi:hypothetical protein
MNSIGLGRAYWQNQPPRRPRRCVQMGQCMYPVLLRCFVGLFWTAALRFRRRRRAGPSYPSPLWCFVPWGPARCFHFSPVDPRNRRNQALNLAKCFRCTMTTKCRVRNMKCDVLIVLQYSIRCPGFFFLCMCSTRPLIHVNCRFLVLGCLAPARQVRPFSRVCNCHGLVESLRLFVYIWAASHLMLDKIITSADTNRLGGHSI